MKNRAQAHWSWKKSSGHFSTDENLWFSRELRARNRIPAIEQAVCPEPAQRGCRSRHGFVVRAALAAIGVGLLAAGAAMVLLGLGRRADREAEFLATCRAASAAGDWERLERSARAWTAARPDSTSAWLSLAEAAVGRHRPADAAAALDRVADDDPRATAALLARVDLLFTDVGRPFAAVDTCERIIRIDPRRHEPHQRLAFFYVVTLQRSRLAEEARRTIAAGCDAPETFVYLVGSQWLTLSNTEAVNEGWLRHDPDNELFLVAAACGVPDVVIEPEPPDAGADPDAARPQPGPATARLARIAALCERFPRNRELLAIFLQQASTRGDLDELVRLLARAPADAAGDCRFWRFKAWAHAARGELAEAEESLLRALAIDPFDQASRHELAGVLRKTGRAEAGAKMAEVAEKGRTLRREILQQPEIRTIPKSVLADVATYAAACGEHDIAERLRRAIELAKAGAPR